MSCTPDDSVGPGRKYHHWHNYYGAPVTSDFCALIKMVGGRYDHCCFCGTTRPHKWWHVLFGICW